MDGTSAGHPLKAEGLDTVWMKHCMRWAEDAGNYRDLRSSSSQMLPAQGSTWSMTVFPGCLSRICPYDQFHRRYLALLRMGTETRSSFRSPFQTFLPSAKGKVPEAQHKGLGKVRPSCELNTKGRCVCFHDTNPNCWMNWGSAHPQHP